MKASDVSFFARHVEKFILGLGVLVLLVICLLFVIGDPYAVDLKSVPGSEKLTPLEVEELVLKKKDTLDVNLQRDKQIEPPTIPDYHEGFSRTYQRDLLPNKQLAALGLTLPQDIEENGEGTPIYALPEVPMPLNVLASASHGLMDVKAFTDPNVAASYRQLINNVAPADFRSVSVEATFDLGEWKNRFAKIPADKRVPDYFVRSRLLVTGVYLIRQTQDPISKRWGEDTIVPVLPDQIAYLPDEQRQFTTASAEEAEQTIRANLRDVIRPEFPPLMEGSRTWNPPSAKVNELSLEQQKDLDRLNRQISTLERQIRSAENRPSPNTRTVPQRRTTQPQFDEMDMYQGGYQGGFGPPSRPTQTQTRSQRPTTPTRDNSPQARLQMMREKLNQLTMDRDMLQAGIDPKDPEAAQKLQQQNQDRGTMYGPGMMPQMPQQFIDPQAMYEMQRRGGTGMPEGYGAPGMPGMPRMPGMPGMPGAPQQAPTEDVEETLPAGQIRIWAHDLTVEPGRTYRYKIVAGVMNPLFHRKRLNPAQVDEHMNKITLVPSSNEIRKTGWSEPVSVDPEFYFFVVGGKPSSQIAKVQVFRIYNGVWRQAEFDVQPGDPIGGEVEIELLQGDRRKVNMEVGAFMVDMISVPIPGNAVGTSRLLYLDPLTNRIAERDVNEDRNADDLQRLRFEVDRDEAAAQAQAAAIP